MHSCFVSLAGNIIKIIGKFVFRKPFKWKGRRKAFPPGDGLDHLLVRAWEGLPITSRAATAAPTLCLLTFFRRYLLPDGSFCLSLTLHCILFAYILSFVLLEEEGMEE